MIEIQFEQQQLPMNALRYLTVLYPNFFCVERQRLSGEGGEKGESDMEDGSGTTRIIELPKQLEDVNNLLQLAEREKSQYVSRCCDLEEQIKISEDRRKDLFKKCNDLEQQVTLKERELSWKWQKDFEEMKSELEAKLENVNKRFQLAESEKNQYASQNHYLEKQIESCEDQKKDLSKKCYDLEQQVTLKERELSWKWKKDFEEMKSELEAKLENVNKRFQLAESEKNQYASQNHNLEKQIESCEDQKKDLLKKYSDLEQQLNLKEDEWSSKERDFQKTTDDLERQLVEVNNQQGRAESDKGQYSNTCNALKREIEEYKGKCADLELQVILKKRDFEKEKSELQTKLKEVSTRLERAESEKSQCTNTCNFLKNQNDELTSKLLSYEVETNEQTNLNIPNASHGNRTSATGSREGGLEGKKHK